jgi:hypothetical protein
MEALPKDVLVTHIINRLPPKALLKLRSTCRALKTLIEKTDIWTYFDRCLRVGDCVKCRTYVKILDLKETGSIMYPISCSIHVWRMNMGAQCTQGCSIQWHERCITVDQSGMICPMPNCTGYLYKGGLLHKGEYSFRGLYYSGE